MKIFFDIHKSVKKKLRSTNTTMCKQQHKHISTLSLEVGDSVNIPFPERESKLSTKFVGPHQVIKHLGGHKSEIWEPYSRFSEIIHSDRLKITNAESEKGEPPQVETS